MVPDKTELFRDDVVPRIDILIDQESLDFILAPENRESDELFDATFIFENGTVRDTLENVGFRLRGNTSRAANKKSFKVDINAFVSGRKYYGVQKINLNGQHNDPTSARAKICTDLADRLGIPSMRTNHIQLYINNEYFGLYSNTEHIDQNFVKKRFGNKNGNLYKCLYPADLNYKGNTSNPYKEVVNGRRIYELKNNQSTDDYTDLANFITILTQAPQNNLACELEKHFNVDLYLKSIIFDILIGNWDGPIYNKNNFYLYKNQATGLFEYIPYDLDNTLGIDWLNKDWANRSIYQWSIDNEERPIYNRLMENQEYRDRFSFYMLEVLLNIYNEAEMYPYLDDIKDRLDEYIENDPFYPLDYGFDIDDFNNGFELALPFFQTDYGIKEFIQTRLIATFSQLEINDIRPIITNRIHNHPNEKESLEIQAKVIDDKELTSVEFCYYLNNNPEICIQMLDDGLSNDGEANDGIYGLILPPFNEIGYLKYEIKAIDDLGQTSISPRCERETVIIEEEVLKLSINEFMASNNTIKQDVNGEFDDWIELYNYGANPIYLGDKYLSDNPENTDKWSMPNYTMIADEYLLIWADDDRNQGTFHTNFKLSKTGEFIGIYDNDETEIDKIEYNEQESDISLGRIPNGTGGFITIIPTPESKNLGVNSVLEESNSNLVDISPNPTSNNVSINTEESILKINLLDALGQVINIRPLENEELQLPDASGIYFIQIFTKNNPPIVKKVIKQ